MPKPKRQTLDNAKKFAKHGLLKPTSGAAAKASGTVEEHLRSWFVEEVLKQANEADKLLLLDVFEEWSRILQGRSKPMIGSALVMASAFENVLAMRSVVILEDVDFDSLCERLQILESIVVKVEIDAERYRCREQIAIAAKI